MITPNDAEHLALRTAANMAELFAGGARDSGQRYLDLPAARASDRQLQDASANSAFLLDPESDPEPIVAQLTSFYGETGSPWLLWSPARSVDFSACGITAVSEPPLMLRTADANPHPTAPELDIREVQTARELEDFCQTFNTGYPVHHSFEDGGFLYGAGMIGTATRFWNGYVGDVCVSVSSATFFAGLLTVNAVATLDEYRRRGYGAALTDIAARSTPGVPVLLTASDEGRPVYERLGFETIGHFRLWHHP